jgi:hypothetical protein
MNEVSRRARNAAAGEERTALGAHAAVAKLDLGLLVSGTRRRWKATELADRRRATALTRRRGGVATRDGFRRGRLGRHCVHDRDAGPHHLGAATAQQQEKKHTPHGTRHSARRRRGQSVVEDGRPFEPRAVELQRVGRSTSVCLVLAPSTGRASVSVTLGTNAAALTDLPQLRARARYDMHSARNSLNTSLSIRVGSLSADNKYLRFGRGRILLIRSAFGLLGNHRSS